MTISYYGLGATKRISDIVFAGSHDASITFGSSNAQTQDLDILEQANAGIRFFDLRILARAKGDGASLVGYHGSDKFHRSKATLTSSHTGKTQQVKISKKMTTGTFGQSLSKMLGQARKFVSESNEFLIFKFDKSTNYQLIAEYCVALLGDNIYKSIGIEFGKLDMEDLKHKVVCVFSDSALEEINGLGAADGILGWRNLNGKEGPKFRKKSVIKPYAQNYFGLQYFGKGGTSVAGIYKTYSMKMSENEKKQRKLMGRMALSAEPTSPNVLGMMYWTSTGITSSIQSRNDRMWNDHGAGLADLWKGGLEKSIGTQLELDQAKSIEYGGVRRIKAFFPNIVMIDFASEDRVQTIFNLNTIADEKLARAYDAYTGAA